VDRALLVQWYTSTASGKYEYADSIRMQTGKWGMMGVKHMYACMYVRAKPRLMGMKRQ